MPMRNMSKTDSGCGASCAATSPETIAAGVGRDGSYVVTDAPRATGRRSMGTIVQQPPGGMPVVAVARQISGVALPARSPALLCPPDFRPPRGLPARSPSAPRASLGASARSPARPRRPLGGLQSGVRVPALALPPPTSAAVTPLLPRRPRGGLRSGVRVRALALLPPTGAAATPLLPRRPRGGLRAGLPRNLVKLSNFARNSHENVSEFEIGSLIFRCF